MSKRYLIIQVIIATFSMFSCSKDDFTTSSTPVYFGENNIVNLSSNEQETEVTASWPYWQMAVDYNEDGLRIEGDTIVKDWYTLIKKDKGEVLYIKVGKNEGEKRSVVISIKNENYHTSVTVYQNGK